LAAKYTLAGSSSDKSNYLLSNAGRSFMIMDVQKVHNYLHGARVYLAGPMDFVASRETEKRFGWRSRVKEFLERLGVTVFDPWEKPRIRGLLEYGKEDAKTIKNRDRWTFATTAEGAATRAELAEYFWETVHIDLRMVDISDFVIAYCPTDIYSVGTVHEIIVARSQHKPVLFVSPPTERNSSGTPSLWYLPLIGSESFFDGFGFRDTSTNSAGVPACRNAGYMRPGSSRMMTTGSCSRNHCDKHPRDADLAYNSREIGFQGNPRWPAGLQKTARCRNRSTPRSKTL
jgi:hypothetical protein